MILSSFRSSAAWYCSTADTRSSRSTFLVLHPSRPLPASCRGGGTTKAEPPPTSPGASSGASPLDHPGSWGGRPIPTIFPSPRKIPSPSVHPLVGTPIDTRSVEVEPVLAPTGVEVNVARTHRDTAVEVVRAPDLTTTDHLGASASLTCRRQSPGTEWRR